MVGAWFGQSWSSGGSTCFSPKWPGFDPRYLWIELICFSILFREVFLLVLQFCPLVKNEHTSIWLDSIWSMVSEITLNNPDIVVVIIIIIDIIIISTVATALASFLSYLLLTSLTRYRRNSVLCRWISLEMPQQNDTSPYGKLCSASQDITLIFWKSGRLVTYIIKNPNSCQCLEQKKDKKKLLTITAYKWAERLSFRCTY